MLVGEAYVLAKILDYLGPSSILDIGSGHRADREVAQPCIGAAFRGHNVKWADLVEQPGVIRCDVTNKEDMGRLPRCEMVTACSLLEHVQDIDAAIENLCQITVKYLLVSVPHVYPHHECPIDNGWRPSPEELSERVAKHGLNVIQAWSTDPEKSGGIADASVSIVLAKVVQLKETGG